MVSNLERLKARHIVDWIDIDRLVERHDRRIRNHGDALCTLVSLELVLRAGEGRPVVSSDVLADPDLVRKSLEGDESSVRPCIGCNEGCVGRRYAPGSAVGVTGCTVNPNAGFEYLHRTTDESQLRIDGMQAEILAHRGGAARAGSGVMGYDTRPLPASPTEICPRCSNYCC